MSLKTPTQRFGLGVVRKEDFDSLMKCLRKCVSVSTRMAAVNNKSFNSARRQSLLMEKFSTEDMLMIGRQGEQAGGNFAQTRYMGGSSSYNMKRRGSAGTISISSSDNGSYDGTADHHRGGDERGGGLSPRGGLADLEPVKENRTFSGASADVLMSDSASSGSEEEGGGGGGGVGVGTGAGGGKRPSVDELAKKATQYAQKLETKRTSKDGIQPFGGGGGEPPPPPVVVESPNPPPPPAATPPADVIKAEKPSVGFKLTSPSTWKTKRGDSNAGAGRISENSVEVGVEKERTGSVGKMSARISQLSTFSNFKKAGSKTTTGGRGRGPGRRKTSAKSTGGGVWSNYVEKTKKEGGGEVAPSKDST